MDPWGTGRCSSLAPQGWPGGWLRKRVVWCVWGRPAAAGVLQPDGEESPHCLSA